MRLAISRPPSVATVLRAALEHAPHAVALVTRSERLTYTELDERIDRAADALWALGVRPGTRLAVCLPNDTEVVTTFHAAQRLGAVWLGVNRNLAAAEKRYLLADADVSVVLTAPEVSAELAAGPWQTVPVDVVGVWRDAVQSAPRASRPEIDAFAPAALAYTSGTTGRPKAAVHSQHNLVTPGAVLVADRGYDGRLRKGDCFPLTILNMQVLTTVLTAQALGCAVIMDRIDAAGVAEWIERERVTTWNGPPALLYSLCEHPDVRAEALGSLDEVWTGGADCPESLRERFAARFGRPVLATYGLTEAPSVVSIDPRSGDHRPGASGRPLPHLAVTIRDSTDAELPIGEDGEVCVGAVGAGQWAALWRPMLGYRSRPEASVETLRGGVLHTGDIGHLDTNGFLHLRDRLSLVIIRGGANVYPAEVERVLMDIDGVAAAAVYGIADERLGERVMAVVEATPAFPLDTEELRVQCARELARYKVPERIEVVDELPRNAMGKIVRAGLAEFVSRRARPATPSD